MKETIKNIMSRSLEAVRAINERYKTPRIQMTPGVKFALLFLRIYLFALIGLMLYKFITLLK